MNKILGLSLVVGFLFFRFASVADAQVKMRAIEETIFYKNSPIVIVSRELGDKAFERNRSFLGDRDWLKHLAFDVKNGSNKNITYFEITLLIPKQGGLPYAVAFRVEFGYRMPPDGDTPESASRRPVLKSGETIKARISDSEYSRFNPELEKYGMDDVKQVILNIRTVEFDDGTTWIMGGKWKRDPTDKKRWVPIDGPVKAAAVYLFPAR